MRFSLLRMSLVVAAAFACWSTGMAHQEPPPGVPVDSSSSRIVSPTVVATTMVRTVDRVNSLQLMVLWRGAVGWFLKPGPRGGGAGGRQGVVTARVQYAGLDLRAELQLTPRQIRIQGNEISLNPPESNVILVDHVDGPDMKVVSTLKIDPVMTSDKQVEPLLKQSLQIVTFLQCDQKLADPLVQPVVDRICQSVMGK